MKAYEWKETMDWEGEPALSLALRRPELNEEDRAQRRMGRYYRRMGELWKARWVSALYPRACAALAEARESSRPFRPWTAELSYTITLEDEGLLSLYLDAVETGPGRPLTVRSADTWDRKTGIPCSLADFLPSRAHWRRDLLAELQRQTAARLGSGESLFFQDAEERVKDAFSPHRFYLTEDRVALFFPMLSLGSAAEGIPVFLIPRVESPQRNDQKNPEKD